MKTPHTSGYSVIIALFIMSFLLVLTTGIFSLVLWELNQNRGEQWYLAAYAWAESGQELALLTIKQNGYGYHDSISAEMYDGVTVEYDLWYRVSEYVGSLTKFKYDIIPLFSQDLSWVSKPESVSGEMLRGTDGSALLWNIIGESISLAGFGEFDRNSSGKSRGIDIQGNIEYDDAITLEDFLEDSGESYLILFNAWDDEIEYKIQVPQGQYFTLPRTQIISSGRVKQYKQNLRTSFDNTTFLDTLKYSIFSPNNTP